jgi:hypothetical protein
MADQNRSWVRDLLLVPLIVGLVIAAFSYIFPKFFAESRQLSYQIEEPLAYLDKTSLGSAAVRVNDVAVPEVYAARVRVWNSGTLPLKDLPVRFEFTPLAGDFRVLSASHNTKPAREFGLIAEQGSEVNTKRFVYALMNPGDEDDVVFLTTAKVDVKVFSKAEGLSVKAVEAEKQTDFKWYHAALGAMLASILSSIVEAAFKGWRQRRKAKRDGSSGEI